MHHHPASVTGGACPTMAVASLLDFVPLLVLPSPREESQAPPGERKLCNLAKYSLGEAASHLD